MKKIKITYYGEKGTIYSEVDDTYDEEYYPSEGEWEYPFSNTKEESTAFGLVEAIMQSDYCPYAFQKDENIIKVKVEYIKE